MLHEGVGEGIVALTSHLKGGALIKKQPKSGIRPVNPLWPQSSLHPSSLTDSLIRSHVLDPLHSFTQALSAEGEVPAARGVTRKVTSGT